MAVISGGSTGSVSETDVTDAVDAALVAADVAIVNRTTGGLKDTSDVNLTGIASMTFAQMNALTADQLLALAGMPVHISDVHNNSSGVGGSYIVRDSSPAGWAQVSGPWYFATLAEAVTAAAYVKNLRVTCGDVGYGLVDLRWDGTSRFRPVNRSCVLAGASYGSIASPTNTINTGVTSGYFGISTPTFPEDLFAAGDILRVSGRLRRNNANATAYCLITLGTAGTASDAVVWDLNTAATDNLDVNFDVLVCIGTATSFNTQTVNLLGGSGVAGGVADKTDNFNVGSVMILSAGVGVKNTSDTVDLLCYNLIWQA